MNKTKTTIVASGVLALSLLGAGCSNKDQQTSNPPGTEEAAESGDGPYEDIDYDGDDSIHESIEDIDNDGDDEL